MARVRHLLPEAGEPIEARDAKLKELKDTLFEDPKRFFPEGRTDACLWSKQQVPVRAKPDPAAICVLVSGTECQEYSAMNKQAKRQQGASFATFLFWVAQIRADPLDLVFHENVMNFDPAVIHDFLGDLMLGLKLLC